MNYLSFLAQACRWLLPPLALLSTRTVLAASLQISPVLLSFPAGQLVGNIALSNPDSKALYGQVRVLRWSQANGVDVLEPAHDLVASPPLIQVEPHSEQMVRLVRLSQTPMSREQSYRLLIDELPSADEPPSNGVKIRVRYSVPVFVAAASADKPQLTWQLVRAQSGWSLRVDNSGGLHAQIGRLQITVTGKNYVLSQGLLGYVLPGAWRQWPVSTLLPRTVTGAITLEAMVNAEPLKALVQVELKSETSVPLAGGT